MTAAGDLTQLGASAWLAGNGADVSKVHFIQITFADMRSALENGLADAAVITEPWLSSAVRSGNIRQVAKPYDAVAPQFLIGVWFTTSQYYAKNAAQAKRFADVIYQAARWANAHHDLTAPILA